MNLHKINIKNLLIIYLILPISLFLTGIVLADSTTVIMSFPAPAPDPQGLAWDGEFLWVADDSTDSLYKIDPEDGSIVSSFPTPGSKPRGLTWDGNHLWCADTKSDTIYKLDTNYASVISSIPAPHHTVKGLTWDGQYLYCCYFAGWSSSILKINLSDTSFSFFVFTRGTPQGLACNGENIWNCEDIFGTTLGWIDQYTLSTGNRTNSFDTPGYYPTGLMYDGRYFWLTDNETDSLYKLIMPTTGIDTPHKLKQNSLLSFTLYQNYPNPFNAMTIISYDLLFSCDIILQIFNINGKCVKTIVNKKQESGSYRVVWDGKDDKERDVSSSVYIYNLKVGNFNKTKKMLIIH